MIFKTINIKKFTNKKHVRKFTRSLYKRIIKMTRVRFNLKFITTKLARDKERIDTTLPTTIINLVNSLNAV